MGVFGKDEERRKGEQSDHRIIFISDFFILRIAFISKLIVDFLMSGRYIPKYKSWNTSLLFFF